jgi:hypothetical protein
MQLAATHIAFMLDPKSENIAAVISCSHSDFFFVLINDLLVGHT